MKQLLILVALAVSFVSFNIVRAEEPASLATAAKLREDGIRSMKAADDKPEQIIPAAEAFASAQALFETLGKDAEAAEMNSFLFWCRRRMSTAQIDEYLKRSPGPGKVVVERLTKSVEMKVDDSKADAYFSQAESYAAANPAEHLLIAARYLEVAERFRESGAALKALDRALKEMVQHRSAAKQAQQNDDAPTAKAVQVITVTPKEGEELDRAKAKFFETVAAEIKKFSAAMAAQEKPLMAAKNFDRAKLNEARIEHLKNSHAWAGILCARRWGMAFHGGKRWGLSAVEFDPDGTVLFYGKDKRLVLSNERMWRFKGSALELLNENGKVFSFFEYDLDYNRWIGGNVNECVNKDEHWLFDLGERQTRGSEKLAGEEHDFYLAVYKARSVLEFAVNHAGSKRMAAIREVQRTAIKEGRLNDAIRQQEALGDAMFAANRIEQEVLKSTLTNSTWIISRPILKYVGPVTFGSDGALLRGRGELQFYWRLNDNHSLDLLTSKGKLDLHMEYQPESRGWIHINEVPERVVAHLFKID